MRNFIASLLILASFCFTTEAEILPPRAATPAEIAAGVARGSFVSPYGLAQSGVLSGAGGAVTTFNGATGAVKINGSTQGGSGPALIVVTNSAGNYTSMLTTNTNGFASASFLYKVKTDANGVVTNGQNSLTESDVTTSDVTTGNASTSKHGFLPKLSGSATDVLKGDGTFGAASGGSSVTFVPSRFTTNAAGQIAPTNLWATLTDGASIPLDASGSTNQFAVTLGGNRTLANPSGYGDRGTIRLRVRQDATGQRTLAVGTMYRFGSDITTNSAGQFPLSTNASKTDYFVLIYNEVDDKWDVLGGVRGF